MAHPFHHAESSARKFGGRPEDYQAIHDWFDASKAHLAHFTHRALRHHAAGIFEAEQVFGVTITNSDGRKVPVRFIGEQHVKEDCGGKIPSVADWLRAIEPRRWMSVGRLADGEDQRDPEGEDRSLEVWRRAVAEGRTILGYADWIMRKGTGDRGMSPALDHVSPQPPSLQGRIEKKS